jgi:hypothetical protein
MEQISSLSAEQKHRLLLALLEQIEDNSNLRKSSASMREEFVVAESEIDEDSSENEDSDYSQNHEEEDCIVEQVHSL